MYSEVLWRIFAKLGGCMQVDLPFALEGFFFEKVNGSTGERVTFAFHCIIYAPASRHMLQRHFLLGKQQSLIRRLLLCCMSTTYLGGPANCYWGVLFLKGQRVDGSTGQRLTFTFTILYIIADDARLTPPRCKKHTAYDDTRLTSHRCKKHTVSFTRSTGKFPSLNKKWIITLIINCMGSLWIPINKWVMNLYKHLIFIDVLVLRLFCFLHF